MNYPWLFVFLNEIQVMKCSMNISSVLFLLCTIAALTSCNTFQNESNILMQESYEVVQGACGTINLSGRMAENYDNALKELKREKQDYFSQGCPDAPCHEIKLKPGELVVIDDKDQNPPVTFYKIRVLDKYDEELLHSVVDVITSNGYYYKIHWCPDAPPIDPNEKNESSLLY